MQLRLIAILLLLSLASCAHVQTIARGDKCRNRYEIFRTGVSYFEVYGHCQVQTVQRERAESTKI